jgi:hypothetical protein
VGGKLVRETIGTMAKIPNVADARALASASMQKAQAGTHPVEEKRRSREDELRQAEEAALASVARQRDTEFMKRYMRGRKHSARFGRRQARTSPGCRTHNGRGALTQKAPGLATQMVATHIAAISALRRLNGELDPRK